jgi:predicted Rossmann-fold nucleotide-binding protein
MAKKYKIGVYGSAAGDYTAFVPIAEQIGRALGEQADSVIVITGACPGLPYAAAKAAAQRGVAVWGFSSSCDEAAQRQEYAADDLSIYRKLIYVPADFPFADNELVCKKYRNVISTASCDAAIIISGRWGTLNEFTNLIDFGKTVGVLTGTGGIADELPALARKIFKAGQGEIIFDGEPKSLVEKLISSLRTSKQP